VIPAITKGWPFTPIDAINLLDKVLLHEFTHTDACGRLRDVRAISYNCHSTSRHADGLKVPMAKGGAPIFGVAYGWNAATTLAKQENVAVDDMPVRNSDSFALFASGECDTSLACRLKMES
jgi:hypothetical protein